MQVYCSQLILPAKGDLQNWCWVVLRKGGRWRRLTQLNMLTWCPDCKQIKAFCSRPLWSTVFELPSRCTWLEGTLTVCRHQDSMVWVGWQCWISRSQWNRGWWSGFGRWCSNWGCQQWVLWIGDFFAEGKVRVHCRRVHSSSGGINRKSQEDGPLIIETV